MPTETPEFVAPRQPAAATLALFGLGANLGDAQATLRAALEDLARIPHSAPGRVSSLWRSAPVDAEGPDYCNAVAELHTCLQPLDLLHHLQGIERHHGRRRPHGVRNAPRTLDLDLLCLGSLRMEHAELVLPHPRMHQRAFVLAPLQEIHPEWRLPDGRHIADAVQGLRAGGQRLQRIAQAGV